MQKSKQLILLGAAKPSVEAQYLTIGGGKEMPVLNKTEKDLYNIILNDLYNFRLFWKTSDIFSSKVSLTKLGFDSGSELWWSNPWGVGLFCTNGNTGTPHQTQIQIQCNTKYKIQKYNENTNAGKVGILDQIYSTTQIF